MNCPNCNSKLSCGCQKRVASDKKQCCSACVTQYEQNLKKNPPPPVPKQASNTGQAPAVNNIILAMNNKPG